MRSWVSGSVALLVWVLGSSFNTAWAQATTPADALGVVRPIATCASLKNVSLADIGGDGSGIESAVESTSDGVKVCSVFGRLAPAINFQVLLPAENWTQRYLQTGCGGLCGQLMLKSGASYGCQVLNDGGFVMAATDMGHSGGMADSGQWGADARQRTDFAYRAQHLTAVTAKLLIEAYYGRAPRYAYFNGCSDGGREGLMETMRFPGDFNGVIAGAPAMMFQVQNTLYHAWQARSNTDASGHVILLADRLPLLHDAVLRACDALDGVKDGLVAEPASCAFDVGTITCDDDAADTSACLRPSEAAVVHKFYEGPVDAATGAHLTAGQPLYGSELDWAGVYVADHANDTLTSTQAALPVIRYLAFEEARPTATLESIEFDEATLRALRPRHLLLDATNPDLSAFAKSGGKLLLWHGLADPHISPANTLSLHNAMKATMGDQAVEGFERLYFLPGVAHCGNGQGPSKMDLLTPMMAWVESGVAPDAVMTSSARQPSATSPSSPVMTRPVYPYPMVARYIGSGDVHDAANWTKGGPAAVLTLRDWAGSDLFGRYEFKD